MTNVSHNQISGYLGNFGPEEFESVEDIREYFEMKNLVDLFGAGDYSDRIEVMEEVIEQFNDSRN